MRIAGGLEKNKDFAEANIQAEFYHQCRIREIDCLLEYKRGHCRFDIVILQDRQAICIIETKRFGTRKRFEDTKQFKKYNRYGVPVIRVSGFKDIIPTIHIVEKLCMIDS